ncbi:ribosome biogenesis GTPase Der [Hyphomonas sp.]|uniref:ribosome biogenesis GTPase Der n=1 Tax=Hyphomonas sp. TaxID=87 RepID=UPI0030F7302B
MPLKLAILGRPNVGKSTLFNRLAGKKIALVDDQPGVTRDRKQAEGRLASLPLILIDTAGYENVHDGSLQSRMREQTEAAIAEAEVALFLIDARVGVTIEDQSFAALLRKANIPVVLAANKAEGKAGRDGLNEAWELGFGEPVGLSAEHGEGMADLFEAIRQALGEDAFEKALEEAEPDYTHFGGEDILDKLSHIDIDDQTLSDDDLVAAIEEADVDVEPEPVRPDKPIKLTIVGRPNAGKSTLINQLLQSDRLLTGPEAGITRDSISIDWEWEGRRIRLVDTAGLRRKSRVQEKLERMSTGETIRSLKYADIIALVMDADEAMEKQDLQIADLALREGRGIVLVISKWDLVKDPDAAAKHIRDLSNRLMPNAGGAPIVFLSGLTGRNIEKLMPAVVSVYANWTARVKTGDLNRWLRHTIERHPPPSVHGKRIKPRYMAQMKARPPTFVLIASRGDQMPDQCKRYLVNGVRDAFDMNGVPIRLFVRQGKNPYADKAAQQRPSKRYKPKH